MRIPAKTICELCVIENTLHFCKVLTVGNINLQGNETALPGYPSLFPHHEGCTP